MDILTGLVLSVALSYDIKNLEPPLINILDKDIPIVEEIDHPTLDDILEDLTLESGYTSEELGIVVSGELSEYTEVYTQCEEEYGVNSIFLYTLTAVESSYGESSLAKSHNNLSGVLVNGEYKRFDSYSDSIKYTANLISSNYLDESGKFYNGKSLEDVNIRYSINSDGSVNYYWSELVSDMMRKYYEEIEDNIQ